jgi:hypothetical protein
MLAQAYGGEKMLTGAGGARITRCFCAIHATWQAAGEPVPASTLESGISGVVTPPTGAGLERGRGCLESKGGGEAGGFFEAGKVAS